MIDYTPMLTKLAKMKNSMSIPADHEHIRFFSSIFYDKENSLIFATNGHLMLRVRNDYIGQTHSYEPKLDITSTGRQMPDFSRYDRIFYETDTLLTKSCARIETKIIKKQLAKIKAYKKFVRDTNNDDSNDFYNLVSMLDVVRQGNKILFQAHYKSLWPDDDTLFEIQLGSVLSNLTTQINCDYAIILLDFIADLQKDKNAIIIYAQADARSSFVVSDVVGTLLVAPIYLNGASA